MLSRVLVTPSAGARRAVAALLVGAGLVALMAGAAAEIAPVGASLSLARKFWRAGHETRLLNTPFFSKDLDLSVAALRADRSFRAEDDALLVLPRATPPDEAEERRRRAAYLLAPRRVVVVAGDAAPFRLEPLRERP